MTQTAAWTTEAIRFTLLGIPEGVQVSWQSLVGAEPESVTNRPAQQLSIQEGPFANGRLVITSHPGRVDIALSAIPTDPMKHPSLGDFVSISAVFEARLNSIKLPTVARLAMGVTLNVFPESLEKSKTMFRELVPELNFGTDVSDLMLQVNRVKKFPKISGMVMNRLTRWSQLLSQTVQYQNSEAMATKNIHLIQLELDLNTSPTSKLPHADAYKTIIAAFFSEARSLAGVKENANG
ncbi:hypothetical protein GIW54_05390 [Pseudomonas proteolytica]|uniref:Uncharacterized protein n=1 Tax=Pseudomonas proteolytica TaxID=219574 RepID=A0AAW4ZWH8_9PSED|nr:hypothetical protein [Pseudomonas proteolytica]MCF5056874.1 hypothetical protein [Pseudomonas proteolytica]MCF5100195.1 hypothetical protein [Pseudomonas proteolytica]